MRIYDRFLNVWEIAKDVAGPMLMAVALFIAIFVL